MRGIAGFLDSLESDGELIDLGARVSPDVFAAALGLHEDGEALRSRVPGSHSLVGNVLNSFERIGRSIGTGPGTKDVQARIGSAIASPLAPRVEEPPTEFSLDRWASLDDLPIPRFYTRETGRYITAGVICVTDPLDGARNVSFARLKLLGDDRGLLGVSPNHHLGRMARACADAGVPLRFSIVLGVDPAVSLAACLYLGYGVDETEAAGALLGAPIRVFEDPLTGAFVPADAQLVLSCEAGPGERETEGLVSEYHGRYHDYGPGLVTRIRGIHSRPEPIIPVIVPGFHSEHLLIGAVSIAAGLFEHLRSVEPGVVEVAVPYTGNGRTKAVIACESLSSARAKHLIMAAWSAVPLIKEVVIVDASVDPWNGEAVEWARINQARSGRDVLIVPGSRGDRSDPLALDSAIDKIGFHAQARDGDRAEGWEWAKLDEEAARAAMRLLDESGVVPRANRVNRGLRHRRY